MHEAHCTLNYSFCIRLSLSLPIYKCASCFCSNTSTSNECFTQLHISDGRRHLHNDNKRITPTSTHWTLIASNTVLCSWAAWSQFSVRFSVVKPESYTILGWLLYTFWFRQNTHTHTLRIWFEINFLRKSIRNRTTNLKISLALAFPNRIRNLAVYRYFYIGWYWNPI